MTAGQVSERTGFSIYKISRWETGKLVPTPEDVEAFARAVEAKATDRRRVVEMAGVIREENHRLVWIRPTGMARMQARIGKVEESSAHIGTFQPTIIPGLLQTEDYMREVFASVGAPEHEVAAAVKRRQERQQRLHDSSRSFTQIVTEGALRWHVDSPALMAAQLERIDSLVGGEQLRIGVISIAQPAHKFPLQGFDLYDRRAVSVGSLTATAFMTQRIDVTEYSEFFDAMAELAVYGEDARAIVRRVGAEYERMRP